MPLEEIRTAFASIPSRHLGEASDSRTASDDDRTVEPAPVATSSQYINAAIQRDEVDSRAAKWDSQPVYATQSSSETSRDVQNNSAMNLTKLGGVGGVTRSGSWIKRVGKESLSDSASDPSEADSDGDDEDSGVDEDLREKMQERQRTSADRQRITKIRRRVRQSSAHSHPRPDDRKLSSYSRTSTSASTESTDTSFSRSSTSASSWTSSSSAAAFSLRSVSHTLQSSPITDEIEGPSEAYDRGIGTSRDRSVSEVSGSEADAGSVGQSDATSVADRTEEVSTSVPQRTDEDVSSDMPAHMQSSVELIRRSGVEVGPSSGGVRTISRIKHSTENDRANRPDGNQEGRETSESTASTSDGTSARLESFAQSAGPLGRGRRSSGGHNSSVRRLSQSNASESASQSSPWSRAPPPQSLSLAAFSLTTQLPWNQPLSAEFEPAQPRRHTASALGRTRSAFASQYPDVTSAFSRAWDGRVAARSLAAQGTSAVLPAAFTMSSLQVRSPATMTGPWSADEPETRAEPSTSDSLWTFVPRTDLLTPTTSQLVLPPLSPDWSDMETARPERGFDLSTSETAMPKGEPEDVVPPNASLSPSLPSVLDPAATRRPIDHSPQVSPRTHFIAELPPMSLPLHRTASVDEAAGSAPIPPRPPLSRSSTTGLSGRLLRTPTTSEWTTWLVQQGQQQQQDRRVASSSSSSEATRSRLSSANGLNRLAPLTVGLGIPSGSPLNASFVQHARSGSGSDIPDMPADMDADVEVMERLRVLSAAAAARSDRTLGSGSHASSSLFGSDLESVGEDDEDVVLSSSDGEEDGVERGFRAFSRRGSSSSLERMQALHEAISRPASRLGSPALSPYSSPRRPLSPTVTLGMSPIGPSVLGSAEQPSSFSALRPGSTPSSPPSPRREVPPLIAQITFAGQGQNRLAPEVTTLQREATVRPSGSGSSTSGKPRVSSAAQTGVDEAERDRQATAQAYQYPLPPPGLSRTINDFVITGDIGKGAYGLVKKIRLKGPGGIPVGNEWAVKFIIKGRILADSWRRHRVLGPIPIEIHVMDQLRRLPYKAPATPPPWSPSVLSSGSVVLDDPSASRPGHPNICPMLDFFEDRDFYYLVMPFLGKGQDLFDYIESAPNGLSGLQTRGILGQIADALSFLHANAIVHRDLKDENVVLHYDVVAAKDDLSGDNVIIPRAQLIDFGSATHVRRGRLFDTFSGTLDYAAAEILRGEKYAGQEQDVWALGVVGYVLVCGECPFWNGEEAVVGLAPGTRALSALRDRCFPEDVNADDPTSIRLQPDGGGRMKDAADFIMCCLDVDPSARPTAAQACQHRFLVGKSGWTGRQGWDAHSGS